MFLQEPRLTISNTETSDSSNYKLVAANKLGKVETTGTLTVYGQFFVNCK